ncbi:hypothetical protein [Anaerophilus nitritogenes]|uniref:hypothetical protein n=1 Tax=Anaerophilus nitritogenes TaxID=2498136 RepID=UPI00101C6BD0|nr:hypothetical protein [Anaerophilus nitritogenes]
MKRTITINNKEIIIRSLKLKELKSMVSTIGEKIDEVFNFFDKKNTNEDFMANLPVFITENIDFIAGYILQFTDIKEDEIDEMDVLEIVEITKEILKINGVETEKVKDFFQQFLQISQGNPVNNLKTEQQFIETVPNV